jgi:hypothetical protein
MILLCLLLILLLNAWPVWAGLYRFRAVESRFVSLAACEIDNVFAPFLRSPLGEISAGDNILSIHVESWYARRALSPSAGLLAGDLPDLICRFGRFRISPSQGPLDHLQVGPMGACIPPGSLQVSGRIGMPRKFLAHFPS